MCMPLHFHSSLETLSHSESAFTTFKPSVALWILLDFNRFGYSCATRCAGNALLGASVPNGSVPAGVGLGVTAYGIRGSLSEGGSFHFTSPVAKRM